MLQKEVREIPKTWGITERTNSDETQLLLGVIRAEQGGRDEKLAFGVLD